MALPPGFIDLHAAMNSPPDILVNIMGVVVDIMQATLTARAQWMFTLKILDRRLRDSAYGSDGLRVRFFRADPQALPQIRGNGDIVLLRSIKMSTFNGQIMAISNFQTEATVFPEAAIPDPKFEIAFLGKQRLEGLGIPLEVRKMTLEEQKYVIRLKDEMQVDVQSIKAMQHGSAPNAGLPMRPPTEPAAMRKHALPDAEGPDTKRPRLGPKFKLIKDIKDSTWADIAVEVVKKFPTPNGACELYVTDYTENREMYYYTPPEDKGETERDGDTYAYIDVPKRSWPGPWGQLVLKVNLKEPHAHYTNKEVVEGDFVLLKNVKMGNYKQLEGDMWPDHTNPAEVKVSKWKNLEVPEALAVRERKEKYWAVRKAKSDRAEQQAAKETMTRTAKKKLKKQRAAEQAAAAEARKAKSRTGNASNVFDSEPRNGLQTFSKVALNKNIRCGYEEVPITSLRHIIDAENDRHTNDSNTAGTRDYILPFVNAKYRTCVRVVDYEPKQIEDFAVPALSEENTSYEQLAPSDPGSSAKYEWSFALQLADASKAKADGHSEDRIWVNVLHQDAQHLFGNNLEDPRDLGNHPQMLSKLQAQLFLLWGNLAEKSEAEQLSNRAFECCIAEYGIEMDDDDPEKTAQPFGLRRLYSMFGVTIL